MARITHTVAAVVTAAAFIFAPNVARPANLESGFRQPPDSARPWVYWFWLNGNITRQGITADLEAMKQAGIGGVLIMEVDQGIPVGPVDFMGREWRSLFQHVVAEAQRLGLEVNMNDDAGWNGSGGPWIKPEQSMQKVVWTETPLEGPQHYEGVLTQPKAVAGFYRDIAVLATPAVGDFRIENIQVKAAYKVGGVGPAAARSLPPEMVIPKDGVVDLSAQMDATGRLKWEVPAGRWTLFRFGHTSTGVENAPAPATGRGLECDKLSPEGIEANFDGMMAKLVADVGARAGRTLVTTHIDSWENGSQNWTARMRAEFQRQRGYDLLPFLPVFTGRVVGSLEISERFLWDLRQTVSDLVVENYAGRMRELAREHRLKLSIEAYGGPTDDLPYAGRADEPMCEFWMGGGAFQTVKEMASAAHTYGRPILGAESFTADDSERWLQYPGSIKSLGDRAFCEGVSRFVFHRYALQPWLDYRPGMTMGPWGLHYERTQTWWPLVRPWHEYLARCQFMLRQGQFVADLCYLQPEAAPQGLVGHPRNPYDYDNCGAEIVLTRMSVQHGRIVLPSGMSYQLLVLPDSETMTPQLLGKIKELVSAGATVVGRPPAKSPGLSGYPGCDAEVKDLATQLWGNCDGRTVTEHRLGLGRVVWGPTPDQVLAQMGIPPDFSSAARLRYIHRVQGDADIYFVSNPAAYEVEAACTFRVTGKVPSLWWPESGQSERAAAWGRVPGGTRVVLSLEPSGSVFVVFRHAISSGDGVADLMLNGRSILAVSEPTPPLTVQRAVYGVLTDQQRTRDVRAKLQALVDSGERSFEVARMAQGDDPAFGVVKMLMVDYTLGGKPFSAKGTDPEMMDLVTVGGFERAAALHASSTGQPLVEAWQAGRYEAHLVSGRTVAGTVASLPAPAEVAGPWEVRFPAGSGAPDHITLERLDSWTAQPDSGAKYFSGTATYLKTIEVPSEWLGRHRHLYLDLGRVEVMARIKLNGTDLGVLWKQPYRIDVTRTVKQGPNNLEIQVANLWINRLIGDEELPDDSSRNDNGTLKAWPAWVLEGKPSPTGRLSFTTWRLWKKGSPLRDSGLIGPVTLRLTEEVVLAK